MSDPTDETSGVFRVVPEPVFDTPPGTTWTDLLRAQEALRDAGMTADDFADLAERMRQTPSDE
jgi:hypothetical protein